jgi:hypothetical protein
MQKERYLKLRKFLKFQSLDNWLRFTTLLANVGLILTILFTYNNFNKEMYNENQNFAVNLFKNYSCLVLDKNNRGFLDTSYTNHLEIISEDYKYFTGFVLFYAESIYNLMPENEAWINTVEYMLEPHLKYICKEKLLDNAYNEDFIGFCEKLIKKQKYYPS